MDEHKDRMLAGYKVIYKPEHFNHTLNDKNYNGYVYEHRYVMEVYLQRPLMHDEIVHHKDGNKLNNSIDNLELMNRSEHMHRHFGYAVDSYCIDCGRKLSELIAKRCVNCCNINRRKVKDRPSKEYLMKLLESNSYCAVGRMYGVSDNAIRKWLK